MHISPSIQMNNLESNPTKKLDNKNNKTSHQNEARLRRKANRMWRIVAIKESQLNLLRKLKSEEVGTQKI